MLYSISSKFRAVKLNGVLISAALGLALALSSGPVNAASQCKGLKNNACSANSACAWVEGYERKDGRTVKSFCRAKAKAKAPNKKTTNTN